MVGARISQATRARVLEAAHSIGYELPSARRASLIGVGRASIAYLVDEISTSPHPVVNFDGARDAAWESGHLVAAHVTRSNRELEAFTIQAIKRDPSVIGIIYSTIFTRKVSPPRSLEGLPTVLLNCYAEDRRFPCVVPGEVAGAHAATRYLIGKGHRRIGFINGEPWMDASADRLKGYRQALAGAGIAFDPALVRNGDWLPLQRPSPRAGADRADAAADRHLLRQRSDGDGRARGGGANRASAFRRTFRSWAMTIRNSPATPIRRCRRWCCPIMKWAAARWNC